VVPLLSGSRRTDEYIAAGFCPVARPFLPTNPGHIREMATKATEYKARSKSAPGNLRGSMRVAGGLGTIPRVVGDGHEIYRERISIDDAPPIYFVPLPDSG
jgi:hypothetical protein